MNLRNNIIIDHREHELKAYFQAAEKLLEIYPTVKSGIVIENNDDKKIVKICVSLSEKMEIALGKHLWRIDRVCLTGNQFTYFVSK